jgi:hypothetical protein
MASIVNIKYATPLASHFIADCGKSTCGDSETTGNITKAEKKVLMGLIEAHTLCGAYQ